jgi:hypothetical protein
MPPVSPTQRGFSSIAEYKQYLQSLRDAGVSEEVISSLSSKNKNEFEALLQVPVEPVAPTPQVRSFPAPAQIEVGKAIGEATRNTAAQQGISFPEASEIVGSKVFAPVSPAGIPQTGLKGFGIPKTTDILKPVTPIAPGIAGDESRSVVNVGGGRIATVPQGQQQQQPRKATTFGQALERQTVNLGEGFEPELFKDVQLNATGQPVVVETLPGYFLRLLNAPVAVLSQGLGAAAKGKIKPSEMREEVLTGIQKGESFGTLGAESASKVAKGLGAGPTGEKVAGALGFLLGLTTDLIVPIDLGVTDVTKLVSRTGKTKQLFKEFTDAFTNNPENAASLKEVVAGDVGLMKQAYDINPEDVDAYARKYADETGIDEAVALDQIQEASQNRAIAESLIGELPFEIPNPVFDEAVISFLTKENDDNAAIFVRALENKGFVLGEEAKKALEPFEEIIPTNVDDTMVIYGEPVFERELLAASAKAQIQKTEGLLLDPNATIEIGRNVFVNNVDARKVATALKKSLEPIGNVDEAIKNYRPGGDFLTIEDKTLRQVILNVTGIDVLGPAGTKSTFDIGRLLTTKQLDDFAKNKVVEFTPVEWNEFVSKAAEIQAGKMAATGQIKPLFMDEEFGNLFLKPGVRVKIKPEEIATGKVASFVREVTTKKADKLEKALVQVTDSPISAAAQRVVDDTRNQLSSVYDAVKRDIATESKTSDANRGLNEFIDSYDTTPQGAFFRAMVEPFDKDPGKYFDEYFANVFGAINRVTEALETTSSARRLTKLPTSVQAMDSAVRALINTPDSKLGAIKKKFIELYSYNQKEAFDLLIKTHKAIENTPMEKLFAGILERDLPRIAGRIAKHKPVVTSENAVPLASLVTINKRGNNIVKNAVARIEDDIGIPKAEDLQREIENVLEGVGQSPYAEQGFVISDEAMGQVSPLFRKGPIREKLNQTIFKDALFLDYLNAVQNEAKGLDKTKAKLLARIEEVFANESPETITEIKSLFDKPSFMERNYEFLLDQDIPIGSLTSLNVDNAFAKAVLERFKGFADEFEYIELGVADLINRLRKGEPATSSEALKVLATTPMGKALRTTLENAQAFRLGGQTIDDLSKFRTNINPEVIDEGMSVENFLQRVNDLKLETPLKARLATLLNYAIENPGQTLKNFGSAVLGTTRQGLLGGVLAPNVAYHMVNFLTAPAIIASTLGPKYGASSLLAFAKPAVRQVTAALHGTRNSNIVAKSPLGKVYTADMVSKLIAENNVNQSGNYLPLAEDLVRNAAAWSGKTLRGEDVGIARQWVRKFDPTKPNLWAEAASAIDTLFRTNVIIDALNAGKTEAEAVKLGRESLFDYNKLSQFEKDYVSKGLWFWNFQRNSLGTLIRNVANNPQRVATSMRLAQGFPEDRDRRHIPTTEYRESAPFLALLKDTKGTYNLYGPPIPQAQALAEIIDYAAPFFIGDFNKFGEELAVRASSPLVQTALRELFDKRITMSGDLKDPTNYIDPRLIALLGPETLKSMFTLEPVPRDEITPEMVSFDGVVYRIPRKDEVSKRAYGRLNDLLMYTGQQRFIRDIAPLLVGEREGEITPESLQVTPIVDALQTLGAIKADRAKTEAQVRAQLRRDQLERAKDIDPGKRPGQP